MGDFQSYRVDFGVEDEVRENESVTDAMARVNNFVEGQLEAKVRQIVSEKRGQGF